jgi:LPXTG-motif cell wall-anchored protein
MNARAKTMRVLMILAVGAIGLAFTVRMSAQVQTSTDTTHGAATHEVKVVGATVISVEGNDVIVKMDDGTIRHVENVPESAHATVDGREVGVHDLKPGMHLQKTITTTTIPKVITTTKTVTGKVWHVNPPLSVILTMEDGTNQQFKIPKGQKFTVNGQELDAFGLKKGMIVNATKVVEEPITVVQQQAKVTGSMPPAPPPPAPDQPILVAVVTPAPAPAPAAEAAPAALPKTGSELPLTGLLGFLSLAGSAGVRLFRKFSR